MKIQFTIKGEMEMDNQFAIREFKTADTETMLLQVQEDLRDAFESTDECKFTVAVDVKWVKE